jgi:hypothetical protein
VDKFLFLPWRGYNIAPISFKAYFIKVRNSLSLDYHHLLVNFQIKKGGFPEETRLRAEQAALFF